MSLVVICYLIGLIGYKLFYCRGWRLLLVRLFKLLFPFDINCLFFDLKFIDYDRYSK